MSAQVFCTINKVFSGSLSSSPMLGVEGSSYHRLQEHASACAISAKDEVQMTAKIDVRPPNVQAAGDSHQCPNGVLAKNAEPRTAAATEQVATASTSQPQIGGLALNQEPPRGVPVFVMLPLDTVRCY